MHLLRDCQSPRCGEDGIVLDITKERKSAGLVLDNILSKFVVGMAVIAGALTFIMALAVCYGVIGRAFKMDVAWVLELCEYLIYIDVMLATPWVLKIDKHVRVDIIPMLLPAKVQKVLNVIIEILGIVMCGWFFYYSLTSTLQAYQSGILLVRVIPMKKWIVMAFLPLMSAVCTLIFVRRLIVFLTHKEIQTSGDYQSFETDKMNPKYSTSASMDLALPEFDSQSGCDALAEAVTKKTEAEQSHRSGDISNSSSHEEKGGPA